MRWEFLHSKASTNPKSLNILRQDYLVECPIVYANSQKIYEIAACGPTPRPSKQPTTREAHKRHRLPCNKVSQPSKFPNPIQNTKEELFCQKIYVSNFWSLSKILQVSQQLRQTITSHPKKKDGSHLTAIIRLHSLRNRTQGPSVRAAFWGHYDRWLLYNFWLRRGFPLQNWNIKYIFIVNSPSLPIVLTGV